MDFWSLLSLTQEHISAHYAAVLTDRKKLVQLKAYIEKYLRDMNYSVEGYTQEELIDALYCEMAEYSVLTKYLGSPDLEEINVNAWNDIALTYLDGSIVKTKEHFHSPQHAVDIIKRLLHHSNMIIDNATPMAQGHLPGNSRITALKEPIVDKTSGIACSIRLLHPKRVDRRMLLNTEFCTDEMLSFLEMCVRYGVSAVMAGATSSGKTTLLNALLQSIPDNKRIFSIESGSRELSLIRMGKDGISNNVVHTLSRPSDNPAYDITQETLVVASLRFNPDIVVVGEMRDLECHSAVEASLTGHTVVSTVHAGAADAAHMRISLLCQKRFPIDFTTSLTQTAQAFPLVVYVHKCENNARKIMDISECEILPTGERRYRTLYRYNITRNEIINGETVIEGYFEKPNILSDSLRRKLMQYGVPQNELQKFTRKESG
ncbi:MAG TPA: type II secretion system protein E [Ruminococcaceae bacterium]|nr:type II secretion system protein E [Oscillospiraceae bacterium]